MLKPGASVGTRSIVARLCGSASGSVTAITIATEAPRAFVVHHLRPLITQSSPSRSARHLRPVGSLPEVSGSVIEKQLRMSPASSGRSQRSRCCWLACSTRISMFPESGGWQLKA